MNKIVLIPILLGILFVSGCGRFMGDGQQVGYISAVDERIVWGTVFIKPTLESTQEDIYIYDEDNEMLRNTLEQAMLNKQRVKIYYERHFFTIGDSEEEVLAIEILENE